MVETAITNDRFTKIECSATVCVRGVDLRDLLCHTRVVIRRSPMDSSKINSASQLEAVMGSLNPLEKDGVLLLQEMYNNGKGDIVEEYARLFDCEED